VQLVGRVHVPFDVKTLVDNNPTAPYSNAVPASLTINDRLAVTVVKFVPPFDTGIVPVTVDPAKFTAEAAIAALGTVADAILAVVTCEEPSNASVMFRSVILAADTAPLLRSDAVKVPSTIPSVVTFLNEL
jgi:hypothetical protein